MKQVAKERTTITNEEVSLLRTVLPQLEEVMEQRESYIKALEKTIDVLKNEITPNALSTFRQTYFFNDMMSLQRRSYVLSVSETPEKLLNQLYNFVCELVHVQELNVFLMESDKNTFVPFVPEKKVLTSEMKDFLKSGIASWVMEEKSVIIIPQNDMPAPITESYVILPMLLAQKQLGVIIVQVKQKVEDYTNLQRRALQLLANQASVGVYYLLRMKLTQQNSEEISLGELLQRCIDFNGKEKFSLSYTNDFPFINGNTYLMRDAFTSLLQSLETKEVIVIRLVRTAYFAIVQIALHSKTEEFQKNEKYLSAKNIFHLQHGDILVQSGDSGINLNVFLPLKKEYVQ
ncbi:MAG: hypothetical protein FJ218_02795 [Ignavibacteria bacterium]|nr:hypothetical protein [Ignavibacteria bacterium]